MLAVDLLVEGRLWDCGRCRDEKRGRERYCPDLGQPNLYETLEIDGQEYGYCPVGLLTRDSLDDLAEALAVDATGMMPQAGGLDDQWNLDVEKMAIVLRKLRAAHVS